MSRVVLVCGPTGVGKTTYSISLSKEIGAIRFSIDPWMQTLFSQDMKSLEYSWMIERVNRCYVQIWNISEQILDLQGSVVLDLGFTERVQRDEFSNRARSVGIVPEVHFLNASKEVRKKRIAKRNAEKNSNVYAFEVTNDMFNFMEPRFEPPDEEELKNGRMIDSQ